MSGWVKIHESWTEEDGVEQLGSDAAMLHLSALSYSARHLTDGSIPSRALRRLWPVGDLEGAIDRLTTGGFWERTEDGFHIPGWRDHLLASDEVDQRRAQNRERQQRKRRHDAGDHSMCERCEWVRRNGVTNNVTHGVTPPVTNGVSHGHVTPPEPNRPNRTEPTPREGRRGEGGRAPGTRSADATRTPTPRPRRRSTPTITVEDNRT